jgi:hypothetical protein
MVRVGGMAQLVVAVFFEILMVNGWEASHAI